MPAEVTVVPAVGSSATILDLNRALSSGVMLGARDQIQLAQTQMATLVGADAGFTWSPTSAGDEPAALRARQITLPVVAWSTSPDGAAQLAATIRRVLGARFVLRILRHGSTVPVWLRCAPAKVELETNIVAAGLSTTIVKGIVTADTEPYALGSRVDVAETTVGQDPSLGSAWIWDITVTAGDSPTPLILRSSSSALVNVADRTLFTIRRRGTPSALTGNAVQATSSMSIPGVSATPPTLSDLSSDSGMSGGAGVRATYTTGHSGPWGLAVPFSSMTGPEVPGVYRLLVRCRRSGSGLFTLVAQAGPRRLVEAFTSSGNGTRIIDMGLVQIPYGQPAYMAAPGGPVEADAPSINLYVVAAADEAATFDVDYVALMPSDQGCGLLDIAAGLGTSTTVAVDGWDHVARAFTADPYIGSTPRAKSVNGLVWAQAVPMVAPGVNRIYAVTGLGSYAATTRVPAASFGLEASYFPRYSWLG
jgi:hypothetical protein